ncbi:MAG: hypothetical protein GY910_20985 [bacterium]|nr:hypothetical protein [bacterium]
MIHDAKPPILLRDVYDDLDEVIRLVERSAPYTPLGGWMRPGLDPDVENSPMWFQNDWVHADFKLEGSDLFLNNPKYIETAKQFWGADEIVPQSIYANVMVGLCDCGPVHTDNPKFRGRERQNTPMKLLRIMLFSELFKRWEITQATAIWWLNDISEGGGLAYWADGHRKPPRRHLDNMANTVVIGDNHHMFHQVEPVGPFEGGTRQLTARAEFAPAADGSGDWVVVDKGREVLRQPLMEYRVSVLWKADVYKDEAERIELARDTLSLEEVASTFDRDLEQRGEKLRVDLERLGDASHLDALAAVYPEPIPVGSRPSIYDNAA